MPVLHAKAMAVVVAYDMYKEVAEGELNINWKLDEKKVMNFWQFRDCLSIQLLTYDPKRCALPGDQYMRKVTQLAKRKRGRPRTILDIDEGSSSSESASDDDTGRSVRGGGARSVRSRTSSQTREKGVRQLTQQLFDHAKHQEGRLCGNLTEYRKHYESLTSLKNSRKCVVCSQPCYSLCGKCNKPIHAFKRNKANKATPETCFFDFHDDMFHGLAFIDCVTSEEKQKWVPPGKMKRSKQRKYIKSNFVNNEE